MIKRRRASPKRPKAPKKIPDVLRILLISHSLPMPEMEYVFHPKRKWRFDFAWVKEKLALEVEGGVWIRGRHTSPMGFLRDMEKYNAAAVLGWRLIRVTPKQMNTYEIVELIRSVFGITDVRPAESAV